MNTVTKRSLFSLLAAFNVYTGISWFNDQYDPASRTPFAAAANPWPNTCLGKKTSNVLGGGKIGDAAGAFVSLGSFGLGFGGVVIGGVLGATAEVVNKPGTPESRRATREHCPE